MKRNRIEYSRTYYLKHRERILAYQKEYRNKHPQKPMTEKERMLHNEVRRAKYAANIEHYRAYYRQYYQERKKRCLTVFSHANDKLPMCGKKSQYTQKEREITEC